MVVRKAHTPRSWVTLGFLLFALFVANGVLAEQFSSTDYKLLDPVIAPSQFATSTSFQLWSSLGEMSIGTSSSAGFAGNAGFLTFPVASTPVVNATPGDSQVALSWVLRMDRFKLHSWTVNHLGWSVHVHRTWRCHFLNSHRTH